MKLIITSWSVANTVNTINMLNTSGPGTNYFMTRPGYIDIHGQLIGPQDKIEKYINTHQEIDLQKSSTLTDDELYLVLSEIEEIQNLINCTKVPEYDSNNPLISYLLGSLINIKNELKRKENNSDRT